MRKEVRGLLQKQTRIAWNRVLTIVAHDLGEKGGSVRAKELAERTCRKMNWPMTTKEEILYRRAAQLVDSGQAKRGKPARNSTPFVYAPKHLVTPIPHRGERHPDYEAGDTFYKSQAWRSLRYLALRNSKGCNCCGATTADGVALHVDHIIPRYKAPHLQLNIDNLQVLCEDCNIGKGAWDDTDWRIKMR